MRGFNCWDLFNMLARRIYPKFVMLVCDFDG